MEKMFASSRMIFFSSLETKSNEAKAEEEMLQIFKLQPAHFWGREKDSIVGSGWQMFLHVWNMFTIIFCNPRIDPKKEE